MSIALQKEHADLSSVKAMVYRIIISKNGKFLYEILPPQEDVTEIKWKENTIKVNPNAF